MTDLNTQDKDRQNGTSNKEVRVVSLLKRHAVQVLFGAGHSQSEIAEFTGVSVRSVRRISTEEPVETVDDAVERTKRKVGRPGVAEGYREFVQQILKDEPELLSVEILRRAKLQGYAGAKTAMYHLIAQIRPRETKIGMRFEGVAGEFSQHDFGEIRIRYLDGRCEKVLFFCSRLKYSRWVIVTLVSNENAETLVRTLADHFVAFGGVPLCAVFDRPKTVAIHWKKNGEVTEWNSTFALAALEIGFTAEVCWAYAPNQKGSVEALVKWVKGSFFKQRRFHDREDLQQQLSEWLLEVNTERPSRATGVIPAERLEEDRKRLRPMRISPQDLALRYPVQIGPTAELSYEGSRFSMPPDAANLPATLYLYPHHLKIVAGKYVAEHPRDIAKGSVSRLPEHRAAHLAAISGQRGKRYLKRQQLFEVGEVAVEFLTEVVHRNPRGWYSEVEALHTMLQAVGPQPLERAFRTALQAGVYSVSFIEQCLGKAAGKLAVAVGAKEESR